MKTKLILTALLSLALGLGIGAALAWHAYSGLILSREVELAFQAGRIAETLALLRLKETAAAVQALEAQMDAVVLHLAQWDKVRSPNSRIRAQLDKTLVPVKVYRSIYRPQGETAGPIDALLAKIPDRDAKKVCRTGICRLMESNARDKGPLAPKANLK